MRYLPFVLVLLGWYGVTAFAAWALWTHGHPVWSVIVAIVMAAMPEYRTRGQ